jgi:RNA polymerase-interacting CarD/CdnL/TRCF family regulator
MENHPAKNLHNIKQVNNDKEILGTSHEYMTMQMPVTQTRVPIPLERFIVVHP